MRQTIIKLKIGEIIFALKSPLTQGILFLEQNYQKFATEEEAQVFLKVHYGQLPDFAGWRLVFDSGGLWKLFQFRDEYGLGLYSPVIESAPYQATKFKQNFWVGDIYLNDTNHNHIQRQSIFPYPLPQLLMINILSQGYGLMMHACAVKDDDQGYLFVGASGAGKSTIAGLWKTEKKAIVLNDDRVILRHKDGMFWIYGTPWHGTGKAISAESVPLTKIFILKHALTNQTQKLKTIDAQAKLLVRSFPTYWNPLGMEFTIKFLDELVQSFPCYELGFIPDHSLIDYVRWQASI